MGNTGKCGDNLYWTLDDSGTLTISGEGATYNYQLGADRAPWYPMAGEITSLTVEEGVTEIGNFAFFNCYKLVTASLPDTLSRIGICAFYNCKELAGIKIPDGVTDIGDSAFMGCEKIPFAAVPDGTTRIMLCTFARCISLKSVVIPASVLRIDTWAFDDCKGLKTVIFKGTKEQWRAIWKGTSNGYLTNAEIIFES